ncbi:MAG: hypothetical protein ACRCXZ_08745 [Patescibacteria group bacterium]
MVRNNFLGDSAAHIQHHQLILDRYQMSPEDEYEEERIDYLTEESDGFTNDESTEEFEDCLDELYKQTQVNTLIENLKELWKRYRITQRSLRQSLLWEKNEKFLQENELKEVRKFFDLKISQVKSFETFLRSSGFRFSTNLLHYQFIKLLLEDDSALWINASQIETFLHSDPENFDFHTTLEFLEHQKVLKLLETEKDFLVTISESDKSELDSIITHIKFLIAEIRALK